MERQVAVLLKIKESKLMLEILSHCFILKFVFLESKYLMLFGNMFLVSFAMF